MGRAGRAAGAESEPTWSPMNTPHPNLGCWRQTPGPRVQLQEEASSVPRPPLCHSPPTRQPQEATQPLGASVSWSVEWHHTAGRRAQQSPACRNQAGRPCGNRRGCAPLDTFFGGLFFNPRTIKVTLPEHTVQWFSVYSQGWATTPNSRPFHPPRGGTSVLGHHPQPQPHPSYRHSSACTSVALPVLDISHRYNHTTRGFCV